MSEQTAPAIAQAPPGKPFRCPTCGADDQWVADYYEAVWQTVTLVVDDDGGPRLRQGYDGVYGRYDDGSTDDEAYRCQNCREAIALARFVMVEADEEEAAAPHFTRAFDLVAG